MLALENTLRALQQNILAWIEEGQVRGRGGKRERNDEGQVGKGESHKGEGGVRFIIGYINTCCFISAFIRMS